MKTILLALFILFNINTNAQKLDAIEGFWSLAVSRTLTYNNKIYTENEDNYSQWLIIYAPNDRYMILPVGDNSTSDTFTASFEKVSKNEYIYRCTFHEFKWKVVTKAYMTNGDIIQYGYNADKKYLKKEYGKNYKRGMILHWTFTWTKIYPKMKT